MTTPVPNIPGPDHRADVTPNAWITSPAARKYIYLGLAMIVAALVVFGLVTEEQIAQWAQLTVAFLGIGASLLAAVNTPTKS